MAASSVTILLELAGDRFRMTPEKAGLALHALDSAPGMGEIDMSAYLRLRLPLLAMQTGTPPRDRSQYGDLVISVLGQQIMKWEELDRPESHENWVQATVLKQKGAQ